MKERGIGIEVEGEREKERIERRKGERNREERKMSKSHLSTSPRSSSGIASSSSIRLLSSSEGTQPLNFPRPVSPLGRIDTAVPFIHEDSKCEKGVVPIKGAGVSGQCSNMCECVCIGVREYLGVVCKGGGERQGKRGEEGRAEAKTLLPCWARHLPFPAFHLLLIDPIPPRQNMGLLSASWNNPFRPP